MSDDPTTVKIKDLPVMDEKAYAQYKYGEAMRAMLEDPSEENIKAFIEANNKLFEIEDAYRIGARLRLEFVKRHPPTSQNLHMV